MTNNKPSRQEMIDAIYTLIARKYLSFGCKFKLKTGAITTATGEPSGHFIACLFFQQTRLENIEKIIGHPVMIGDVMNYLEMFSKNKIIDVGYLIKHWMIKTMPIEEQSSDCIEFVYNLVS